MRSSEVTQKWNLFIHFCSLKPRRWIKGSRVRWTWRIGVRAAIRWEGCWQPRMVGWLQNMRKTKKEKEEDFCLGLDYWTNLGCWEGVLRGNYTGMSLFFHFHLEHGSSISLCPMALFIPGIFPWRYCKGGVLLWHYILQSTTRAWYKTGHVCFCIINLSWS